MKTGFMQTREGLAWLIMQNDKSIVDKKTFYKFANTDSIFSSCYKDWKASNFSSSKVPKVKANNNGWKITQSTRKYAGHATCNITRINLETGETKYFRSLIEGAKSVRASSPYGIQRCCEGREEAFKGFMWQYT